MLHEDILAKQVRLRDLTFEELEKLAAFHSDTWYYPADAIGAGPNAMLRTLIESFPGHYEALWRTELGSAEIPASI